MSAILVICIVMDELKWLILLLTLILQRVDDFYSYITVSAIGLSILLECMRSAIEYHPLSLMSSFLFKAG